MLIPISEREFQPAITLSTNEKATKTLAENVVSQFSAESALYILNQMDILPTDGVLTQDFMTNLSESAPSFEVISTRFGGDTLSDIFDGDTNAIGIFLFSGLELYVQTHSPSQDALGYNYSLLKHYANLWGFTSLNYDATIRRTLNDDLLLRDHFFNDPNVSMSDKTMQRLQAWMMEARENEMIATAMQSANGGMLDVVALSLNGGVTETYNPNLLVNVTSEQREAALQLIRDNPNLQIGILLLLLSDKSFLHLREEITAAWEGRPAQLINQAMSDSQKSAKVG